MAEADGGGFVSAPQYEYASIFARLAPRTDARLHVAVVVLAEHVESPTPPDIAVAVSSGGVGVTLPAPNMPLLAHREYGHRVGFFRILDALRGVGWRPSVAIDAMTAERYPRVVQAALGCDAEMLAHGASASRAITVAMSAAEEERYIDDSLARVRARVGADVVGWMGPEQSETDRTPGLLRAAGVEYVADWPHDDFPVRFRDGLVSVPTAYGLDDAYLFEKRMVGQVEYLSMATCYATELAREVQRAAAPRSLVLVVRPWLTGQAYRIAAFEQLLARLAADSRIRGCTTREIADLAKAESVNN
jgi:hypothetical protein